MKYIKTLILIALLIPQITFGAVAVGWNATSTASNLLYPNLVNGVLKVPSANEFRANFFTGGFFNATSTATSTFVGGIQTRYLNTTSTTASSTFANGINLTGGCFSINGVCVGTGTGSGTVTSVAMSVPSFLSVSGSPITTSGTLAVSYSGTALPVANGGTASTTNLGGILAGNGASAIKSVIIGSGLTFDGSTLTATGGSSASSTLLSDTNTFSTSATTTFNNGIKGGLLNITSTSASSTFANGINLTGGCFSINGACISGGGGGGSGTVTTITAGSGITLSSGATCTTTCTISATGGGTNFFTNSGDDTILNTGINLNAPVINATSTTGTSTITNALHVGNYLNVGNASTFVLPNYKLDVLDTRDDYSLSTFSNDSDGVNASVDIVFNNDDSVDSGYINIGGIGRNSSTYNKTSYEAQNVKSMLYMTNVGPMSFGSASSTASATFINWLVSSTTPYANGAEAMRLVSTGALGIGTTSPSARLTVTNPLSAKSFWVEDSLLDTSPFVIDESGKVGVGTSSPLAKFSVLGDSDITQLYVRANGTQNAPVLRVQGSGGATLLSLANAGTLFLTGNLGIGTSTPYAPLSVVGQAVASNFTGNSTTATSTLFHNLVISNSQTSTSSAYIYSKTSGFGGRVILEDEGGGACTQITTELGAIRSAVVTCPTEN